MTRWAGYLGLAFLLGQLFIFGPIEIWERNTSDLLYSGAFHLLPGLAAFVISFAAISGVLRCLPPIWREYAFSGVIALALLSWVYSSFFFHDSLQLSGKTRPDLGSPFGAYELIFLAIFILGSVYIIPRFVGIITPILILLLTALSIVTSWRLIGNWTIGISPVASVTADLWRHSRKENVVVILLDTLQSDVTAEVLESNKDLRASFDGFTLFKNTTGVAPTTYPSMVSLHSGRQWDTQRSLPEQYSKDVKEGSFLAELARAGYDVAQVNAIKSVCVTGSRVCTSTMILMGGVFRPLLESVTLFDLSLLKMVPFQLKPSIYSDGGLFLSRRLSRHSYFIGRLVEDLEFLHEFSRATIVDDGPPTAKLLHLMTTHPPFIMESDCGLGLAAIAGGHVHAARCALAAVADYLEVLKREGIYDKTMIVIAGDHGGMRPIRDPNGKIPDVATQFAQLAASASPTLLVKKFEQEGSFNSSLEPMSLINVAALVCAETKHCLKIRGAPPIYAGEPARMFYNYVWKHEYWLRDNIPAIRRFAIVGPVWRPSSWHEATASAMRVKLGSEIDFTSNGVSAYFLGNGWAGAESWGTWTQDSVATFRFSLEQAPNQDLSLTVTSRAFLAGSHDRQIVEIRANGVHVETWQIDKAEQSERIISIPQHLTNSSEMLEISFKIAEPMSPADLGIGTDGRKLGIGISKVVIGQR